MPVRSSLVTAGRRASWSARWGRVRFQVLLRPWGSARAAPPNGPRARSARRATGAGPCELVGELDQPCADGSGAGEAHRRDLSSVTEETCAGAQDDGEHDEADLVDQPVGH